MPRVFPSQIAEMVKAAFPEQVSGQRASVVVDYSTTGQFAALFRLLDELAPEFFAVGGKEYADLLANVETVRAHVDLSRSRNGAQLTFGAILGSQVNPLQVIIKYLERCSDSVPSPTTAVLSFVTDLDLRASIRLDLSAAEASLHHGEWKAATVLAGAASEALLLWALEQRPTEAKATARNLANSERRGLEHWSFDTMIAVAAKLGLIESATSTQAGLAKDFRNLIHPGRAKRTGQPCDKATAHGGLAAVEAIVRDLSARF